MKSGTLRLLAVLVLASLVGSACARPLVLPTGSGVPRPDYAAPFDEAAAGCRTVKTISAELALSGRAVGQRLRGRVQVGLATPAAAYLVAPAPFGAPVFILAAPGERGRLLLPRDGLVVTDAPVREILDALAGLRLDPADLLALLTGCVAPDPQPVDGREYPRGWVAVTLQDGSVAWLRQQDGRWRVAAGEHSGLRVAYERYDSAVAATPRALRIQSSSPDRADVDMRITLTQVERNAPLDVETFKVAIPPGTKEISVEDLRARAPLGR